MDGLAKNKMAALIALKTSGSINTRKDSKEWRDAFNLYQKNGGGIVSLSCGKCYKQVLRWLNS